MYFIALCFDKLQFAATFRAIPVANDNKVAKRIEHVAIDGFGLVEIQIRGQLAANVVNVTRAGCFNDRAANVVRVFDTLVYF